MVNAVLTIDLATATKDDLEYAANLIKSHLDKCAPKLSKQSRAWFEMNLPGKTMVEASKLMRQETGCGLKEAKDWVDSVACKYEDCDGRTFVSYLTFEAWPVLNGWEFV